MSQQTTTRTATVEERKFNGTATFEVTDVEEKDAAKAAARRFWKEEYDTTPSRVVAEESGTFGDRWTVMVADHSSGSLKSNKEVEV